MKKLKYNFHLVYIRIGGGAAILLSLVLFISSLTACSQSVHTHTFSEEWKGDAEKHWHEATCEHINEVSAMANHIWDGGKETEKATCATEGINTFTCNVCSMTKTVKIAKIDHTWSEGIVTVEPTTTVAGEKTYICTVCGEMKKESLPKHEHTYAEKWSNDYEYHWHEVTCSHNDVSEMYTSEKEKHIWDEGIVTVEGEKTFVCAVCSITKTITEDGNYKWPEHFVTAEMKAIAKKAASEYKNAGWHFDYMIEDDYTYNGTYLEFGYETYEESDRIHFDATGLPLVKYSGDYYYNPVTIAQYALSMYSKYVKGDAESYDPFIKACDKLIELQGDDGALRYMFPFYYYLTEDTYTPGWVSGMAQGQALSVYSRAYFLTNDMKYLEAGNKCLEFLLVPFATDGVAGDLFDLDPSLVDYITFEEYPATPFSYTLNGFQFTIIGLYDWSQIASTTQALAKSYFEKSIVTCANLLKYYDLDGFTAYDLGYITYNVKPHIGVHYHRYHTAFCYIFYKLTGNEVFYTYYNKWASYVE